MNLVKLVLNIDASDDSKSTSDLEPLLERYEALFSCIGKIQGECKIHLKEGFVPTAYPAGKVPIEMREKLKQELDRLESLGSSPTLELEVDASKHGLGAGISMNGKVFTYISRSLSKSEQNYSQLEKELCHSLWLPSLPPLPIRKYRAGTEILVADALAKLYLPDIDEELDEEIEIFVPSLVKSIPATDSRLEEIKQGTLADHELKALKPVILEG
ncbi:hypothetical protein QYM36_015916 [Artemia franciscana]|uniref:Reverse transcriptase/retrotransposon-derived protein RNase H-like domain-containing protein n=1 Tax=Artemia franciscana TaxID=6661 RepID=A0AA88HEV3_ARTSF|nr:hypothetical protein QYM36_015916 [Artemia franciscana]